MRNPECLYVLCVCRSCCTKRKDQRLFSLNKCIFFLNKCICLIDSHGMHANVLFSLQFKIKINTYSFAFILQSIIHSAQCTVHTHKYLSPLIYVIKIKINFLYHFPFAYHLRTQVVNWKVKTAKNTLSIIATTDFSLRKSTSFWSPYWLQSLWPQFFYWLIICWRIGE